MIKKYEAVIFDLDGVLIDSENHALSVWKRVIAACRVSVRENLTHEFIGLSDEDMHKIIANETESKRIASRLIFEFNRQWELEVYSKKIASKAGAYNLLKKLHNFDIKIGLNTSSKSTYLSNKTRSIGGLEHFDQIICGDHVVSKKPSPDGYLQIAELLSVKPEKCIVFEDSPAGVESAITANMDTIIVNDILPAERFDYFSSCKKISSLEEIDHKALIAILRHGISFEKLDCAV